jgi:hypothetical protein
MPPASRRGEFVSLHDYAEFIRTLNEHGVRYLVIGGYAVAFHGYPRATDDVDVLIDSSEANVRRVERALIAFVGVAPWPSSLRSRRGMVRIGGPAAGAGRALAEGRHAKSNPAPLLLRNSQLLVRDLGLRVPNRGTLAPGRGTPEPEPGHAVREPGDAVREPGDTVREPGDAVREPGDAVREPGDAVREPASAAREPRSAVRG